VYRFQVLGGIDRLDWGSKQLGMDQSICSYGNNMAQSILASVGKMGEVIWYCLHSRGAYSFVALLRSLHIVPSGGMG